MRRRLLWISEHASPLATLGGADGGGQNVYVAQVARHLAASGHEVDILTYGVGEEAPDLKARVFRSIGPHFKRSIPAGPSRLKIWFDCCGGNPTPVSLTDTISCPFSARCDLMASSRVQSTSCIASMLLLMRFIMTCCNCTRSPMI